MKHVIIGDLHCDRKRKTTYGDSALWDNRVFNILQDIVSSEQPELLVLLGDIFDSYKPDSISVTKLLAILAKVPKVVILEGNHDRPKNTEIEYVFQHLSYLENIYTAKANSILSIENQFALGWHSNQSLFEESLEKLLTNTLIDTFVYLHCNTDDFGNQNDNYISDDFLIRQLYYPYRLWKEKVNKQIRPIFLTYSNGIFHIREYEFTDAKFYNSIRLIKHKKYAIQEGSINIEAIQNIIADSEDDAIGLLIDLDNNETTSSEDVEIF